MKMLISAIAVAVALAGAAMPVHAEEFSEDELFYSSPSPDIAPFPEITPSPDIGDESESLGEFNSSEDSVNDMYNKLLDALESVNFDTVDTDVGADAEPTPTPDDEFDSVIDDELIEPYANYDTYYGSIGTTYLEYMRGYLPKLGFREHYVAARVSQYQYIFAYGEDLTFTGSLFTGHDICVVTWFTNNNGSFSFNVESSFNLSVGNYLVYSDLSDMYPTLADLSGFTLRQVLILAVIVSLVCTMSSMYQVRKIRKIGMH